MQRVIISRSSGTEHPPYRPRRQADAAHESRPSLATSRVNETHLRGRPYYPSARPPSGPFAG